MRSASSGVSARITAAMPTTPVKSVGLPTLERRALAPVVAILDAGGAFPPFRSCAHPVWSPEALEPHNGRLKLSCRCCWLAAAIGITAVQEVKLLAGPAALCEAAPRVKCHVHVP